ncbi:ribosome maturation factor RimP [Pedococcus sp. 5OH_020]|uniref:ribosome maturation factor RimP n=1 Tax=Pedococcus sp. 5OH_020 TaxID=2989814 RepID=UPI0022E9D31A|nr:ribosome maturation factor RimP [Pedococcus sp. 5OH_020]
MSVKEQIRPAVEGPLGALGLLIEDIAVTPAGRRRLVRIWIDRRLDDSGADSVTPTPPLTLDEVADATRAVSDALDDTGAMGEQPYTLEVTSPGVDRHLTEPRHFRRNVSRLVTLTRTEAEPLTGRIVRAGAHTLTVQVPATRKQPASMVDLPYADVSKAVVQVEFSRPADGERDTDSMDEPDTDSVDEPDTDDLDEES